MFFKHLSCQKRVRNACKAVRGQIRIIMTVLVHSKRFIVGLSPCPLSLAKLFHEVGLFMYRIVGCKTVKYILDGSF